MTQMDISMKQTHRKNRLVVAKEEEDRGGKVGELGVIRCTLLWREWINKALLYSTDFPGSLAGQESACNAGDPGLIPGLKIPWRRDRLTTSVFVGFPCSSAEKAMAPHSSTLAWKIPWKEEPGKLQSMRSLRVGHD